MNYDAFEGNNKYRIHRRLHASCTHFNLRSNKTFPIRIELLLCITSQVKYLTIINHNHNLSAIRQYTETLVYPLNVFLSF